MSVMLSWNLRLAVREGRLNEGRALMQSMVESARGEAGTLGYEWFLGEDGAECHIQERFADSDSAMTHLATFAAKFAEPFLQCFKPTELVVYGDPGGDVRDILDGSDAVYLEPFGGFVR